MFGGSDEVLLDELELDIVVECELLLLLLLCGVAASLRYTAGVLVLELVEGDFSCVVSMLLDVPVVVKDDDNGWQKAFFVYVVKPANGFV